jgi:hypothetical protein
VSREGLERRYRRLLRAYPHAWRERREDEIVTVLLDAAPEDQARPAVSDALDLLRSGVTERLRSTGSDPAWASGAGLAGLIALTLVVAFSALQLLVLLPDPVALGSGGIVELGVVASVANVLAGVAWCLARRRTALLSIAVADVAFIWAALAARGTNAPWDALAGLACLSALATAMLASRRIEGVSRRLLGARGAAEAVVMLVLAAELEGWRYGGWHWFAYGGPENALIHAMPHAFVLAFAGGVFLAVLLAPRTPIPLIATALLSPVLLAGVVSGFIRRDLAGNVTASTSVSELLLWLAAAAVLLAAALASARACARRSAA